MEVEKPKTEAAQGKPLTSTQRVFDAVRDLRGLDQIATRETVAELTELKLSIVDDRLRTLVDDGKLKRLLRGVYELVEVFPPKRLISKTLMPNGYVKIEIGDQLLTLSPSEDRDLALLQVGSATQGAVIESSRQHLFLATEMAARVEKLERALKAARASKPELHQHLLPI